MPTCRELGIGIVAYSPLGRGFFTGKLNKDTTFDAADFRSYAPRFQGDAFQKVSQACNAQADAIREQAD